MNDFLTARLNALALDLRMVVRSSIDNVIADFPLAAVHQLETQNAALQQTVDVLETANKHLKGEILALKAQLSQRQPQPTDAVLGSNMGGDLTP